LKAGPNVRLLLRFVGDHRHLWRVWLPLLALSIISPVIALAVPLVERRLIDDVVLADRLDLLAGTAILYGALWLSSFVAGVIGNLLRLYLNERSTLQLRDRAFSHAERLSIPFARQQHSGRTMSLFVNDIPSLGSLFSTTVIGGIGSAITLILSVIVMLRLDPKLAIAAGLGPPILLVVAGFITRPLRPAARRVQEAAAVLNERLQENLTGIREVVAFGQEESRGQHVRVAMRDLLRIRMRIAYMDTALSSGASLFSLAVTVTILIYGSYLVINDQTTLGTVVAMRTLYNYVYSPAARLFGMIGSTQKALGAADRVYALLDQHPQVVDRPTASAPTHVVGQIDFEQVCFSYGPNRDVLHDISFTADPGQIIAIVGPSGAGKTTIVNLVTRFYDPTEGCVRLDGVDLRDLTIHGLRDQIAMVFQDTFLFAMTIRENIAFGRPEADDGAIIAAAQEANIWEFIQELPGGLDTFVGERGVQLSEGQKQRLAIARALLRNPKILILDEPTSALDARSEHLIQSALDNLMEGRTTFIVAHRLSTVQRAHRILVIESGRIVQEGTHAQLLAEAGLYRELCDLQWGARDIPGAALELTTEHGAVGSAFVPAL
jgi:ATP-binding cassette, subfamily B, bacterial MsbA